MKKEHFSDYASQYWPHITAFVIVAGLFVYGYLQITGLTKNLAKANALLATTTARTSVLEEELITLAEKTGNLTKNLLVTTQTIEATKERVGGFEQTVGAISGTVGVLEKLSKTDPELLQKYSRVYFLNEHFVPERLTEIEKPYLYTEKNPELVHALVWPHLKSMIDAASSSGVTLYIKSAYRSFDEQKAIKVGYTVVYGAGTANTFSADQGYSEHQLGTTADFLTKGLGGELDGFDKTPAYLWMQENAHRYGFVLSYPKNNSYYIFEPWHWRYVGVQLATFLHNQNKHFYDLEQRQIDEYLVNIFD
jgi:D-alanyl-D-alanine carboxypeptidase